MSDSSASSIKEQPLNDDQANGAADNNAASTHQQNLRAQAEASEKKKSDFIFVILLSMFAAMGGFVFGFDTGTISGFINMKTFLKNFGQYDPSATGGQNAVSHYYFSKVRSGLIVSIFSIGAAIGGIFMSRTADVWGRKKSIMIASVVYIVGVLIQITAVDKWYQVFIGRLIAGAGIGNLSVVVPMFMSETSPKEIRGLIVSSFQLMITLGIFIGYCVCYGTYDRDDTGSYRIPMGLCFAWAIILIAGVSFMPESPRYLIQQGHFDKARKSMCRVGKREADDPVIRLSMDEITAAVEHERDIGKAGWMELVRGEPRIPFRVLLGIYIMFFQQLTGANYFFYYGTTIFKAIGMDNSYATSMIFGAVNFASTFLALWTVDKFGRRNCLFYGAIAMFVFFIIYASLGTRALYRGDFGQDPNQPVGKAMIAMTCFFILSFAITWGPVAYVYTSELYPLRIKSKAMGLATGFNWLGNFLLSFFTPFITGAIDFRYGYVFAGCLALSAVVVYFFAYETKNLTLEQIDQMFASRVAAWKSSSWNATDTVQPGSDYEKSKASHQK